MYFGLWSALFLDALRRTRSSEASTLAPSSLSVAGGSPGHVVVSAAGSAALPLQPEVSTDGSDEECPRPEPTLSFLIVGLRVFRPDVRKTAMITGAESLYTGQRRRFVPKLSREWL